ncbi:Hyaluronan synthase [Leminorella richardii]|uniref:Hyaluronan synthase n=1 Tax=Leminorella richardii TaxID=158841 RepID=A0A2X4URD4_9GAMM|nr:glycosyltransferase family 2 protein [Leminorella richardii]SQI37182.1 Hyaluronan synthase [Leminorella richardii]
MCNDLVSIIMPAFNAEKYIEEAISSVLTQTYNNIELIIINDFSSDNTSLILKRYEDLEQVIIINLDENIGVSKARNIGINNAKGRYISFLDSDDVWLPTKLQLQIECMKDSNVGCSHSSYFRMSEDGKILTKVLAKRLLTYDIMLRGNQLGNLTGVYDTLFVGKILQKCIGHEDYKMWLDVLKSTNSIGIITPLAKYRVCEKSVSSNKFKSIAWHYTILKNELNNNKFLFFIL